MATNAETAYESFKAAEGQTEGSGEWFEVTQERVNEFADVTLDHQFIHIDPEAAKGTPFGGTIAHGFLTMSMLSSMAYEAVPAVEGTKTQVNYGFNRLRFISPVPVDSRIRGRFVLKSFEVKAGRWQAVYDVAVEVEGKPRPALAAEWIAAGFFA